MDGSLNWQEKLLCEVLSPAVDNAVEDVGQCGETLAQEELHGAADFLA